MRTAAEKAAFLEQGYLHTRGVLGGDLLDRIRAEFDRVWGIESPDGKVNQHKLLRYPPFIDLIEHPAILERHRAVFGNQV